MIVISVDEDVSEVICTKTTTKMTRAGNGDYKLKVT